MPQRSGRPVRSVLGIQPPPTLARRSLLSSAFSALISMMISNKGQTAPRSLRKEKRVLSFKSNHKLLSLKYPHTEISGGPGASWAWRSVDLRPRVARFSITHLCIYGHQYAACRFGAGEESSRDHELTAVGMHPVRVRGGAIA